FAHGKLNGKYTEYWDGKQIQQEGAYENGKKVDEWKLYYNDGKLAGEEEYNYGKKVYSKYFDKERQTMEYQKLFTPPSYKGGIQAFYHYLSQEINYPKIAAANNIEGTVILSFTIKKDGSVEDIEVVRSPDNELSEEAVRVLQFSSNWIP